MALSLRSKACIYAMSSLTSTKEWRTSDSAGGNQRCVLCSPLLNIANCWIGCQTMQETMYYSYPGLLERLAVEQKQEERDELLICHIQARIFYVDEYLGNIMKDVKKMVSQCKISFDTVWALFPHLQSSYQHRSGYSAHHSSCGICTKQKRQH